MDVLKLSSVFLASRCQLYGNGWLDCWGQRGSSDNDSLHPLLRSEITGLMGPKRNGRFQKRVFMGYGKIHGEHIHQKHVF